jgi:hypothetical protein
VVCDHHMSDGFRCAYTAHMIGWFDNRRMTSLDQFAPVKVSRIDPFRLPARRSAVRASALRHVVELSSEAYVRRIAYGSPQYLLSSPCPSGPRRLLHRGRVPVGGREPQCGCTSFLMPTRTVSAAASEA